ncbi:conserved hypothetical protein (plasmid) [Trichormus variabilis ATCC 29413]|uniref:Uncharacterized protein n=2 Tax=Anabaena variabilis TaxID=264691 RepID=Q3M1X7_TRIV2|nr:MULTISPECIES: hypothetical protein [Nostocaceae]ABA25009.1 conserved hypothetical protein [Trichormus variabilis ATCC 29413]MBC1217765.1 hypothetical protein [Trichormus variabilis ARAD]MBC1259351.1 hypothetical protein [Trichormus variabilis V5]MBC1270704.1 hypothetical protein [Trichormus variabilis FSR]MBC1305553.1 hypothetical protein [Trichormus variabilis N2B]
MGKKRITQLLEGLKENQLRDLHNSAAIYTVAQVAVNELQQQSSQIEKPALAALPPSLEIIDKARLLEQYGSYNACRKAAKERGIKFSRTPSWEQLGAALSYAEAFQQIINSYVQTHPYPKLKGTTFELVFP